MDKTKIGIEDKRIMEDDKELNRWQKDQFASYTAGKVYMKEKILEFMLDRFNNTYASEDSSTTALWNAMQDIKNIQ